MTNATPAAAATPPVEGRRPLVYYGWWIVIGAIVAQFIAMGQNQATNLILGPMTEELGWTRSQFILPTSIGVLFSGALGFFVGAQVDRRGARPLLIIGAMISSVALILLAYVDELWQFWVLRGVVLVAGNVMIGNLVVNATISKWFVDRRGWAISMAALGVSGWSVLGTQLLRPIIDTYGWRAGWTTLGFATWVLLIVAMLMRRQPEDYGLLPDGRRASDADTDRGRASIQRAARDFADSFTRGEAARTPALWLLVLAFGFALTGMTALFAHMLQFFVDAGFTRTEAAYFYSTQGAFSLLAKFVWGGAMQRFPARYLVALAFSIAGLSTLGLVLTVQNAPWQVVGVLAATWGLGTGGMIPLSEFVWASYFGRRYIGSVRGLGMPFTVMLTSAGPLYASTVFDRTGSYDIAMFTFVGLWFVGAVLILLARRPRHAADHGVPLAHRLRQPEASPAAAAVVGVAGSGAPDQNGAPAIEETTPPIINPPVPPTPVPLEFVADGEPAAEPPTPVLLVESVAAGEAEVESAPAERGAVTEAVSGTPEVKPEPANTFEAEPVNAEPPAAPAIDGSAPARRPPRSYMGDATPVPWFPLAPRSPAARPRAYVDEAIARRPRAEPEPARSPSEAEVTKAIPVADAPNDGSHVVGRPLDAARNGVGAASDVSPAPPLPVARDYRGSPPRHPRAASGSLSRGRAREVERPPRRDIERPYARSRYMPQSTTSAVLAGVATSLVATAALWFITRPAGGRRS